MLVREEAPAWFAGRLIEIETLLRGFLSGRRLGIVRGDVGVGKTALAETFAQLARPLFPGRVTRMVGFGDVIKYYSAKHPRARRLLVIDDAQRLDPIGIRAISDALRRRDQLSILLVGRNVFPVAFAKQFCLDLENLTRDETDEMLLKRGVTATHDIVDQLFARVRGNPAAILGATIAVRSGNADWRDVLADISDFEFLGLVDSGGRPLRASSSQHRRIIRDVILVNAQLVQELTAAPDHWYRLSPNKFEEVIADLLTAKGYQVTQTPFRRDGGVDLYAAKKDGLGEFLFLVECKRYTPPHKVGVEVVRALQGVLNDHRASGAAIVTTSFFTNGAQEFQSRFEHQLKLHDYLALQQWLRDLHK